MDFIRRNTKRIGTDAAGYFLLLAAAATGWLPGPGGIPLALAGLGLLSINNKWAKDLREYLLKNGGKIVQILFPANQFVQWIYDGLVFVLFILAGVLAWQHAALWQISLAAGFFFFGIFVALMNRERLDRLKRKTKHKQ